LIGELNQQHSANTETKKEKNGNESKLELLTTHTIFLSMNEILLKEK